MLLWLRIPRCVWNQCSHFGHDCRMWANKKFSRHIFSEQACFLCVATFSLTHPRTDTRTRTECCACLGCASHGAHMAPQCNTGHQPGREEVWVEKRTVPASVMASYFLAFAMFFFPSLKKPQKQILQPLSIERGVFGSMFTWAHDPLDCVHAGAPRLDKAPK